MMFSKWQTGLWCSGVARKWRIVTGLKPMSKRWLVGLLEGSRAGKARSRNTKHPMAGNNSKKGRNEQRKSMVRLFQCRLNAVYGRKRASSRESGRRVLSADRGDTRV